MDYAVEHKDFRSTKNYLIQSQLFNELQQDIQAYYHNQHAFHDNLLLVGAFESGLIPDFLLEECREAMVNPTSNELNIVVNILIDYYQPDPYASEDYLHEIDQPPVPDFTLN